ncbi:DUF397 domain-containing protein [Actinomadura madurae]|uniref:DUF397 domain-containing protein n=1 Tax=Actinomadura madurae TaxID=1993 RepID=UPI000DD0D784|nr:DUF397 domain-containing protein [Actinomadura madurae]
MDVTWRKSSCSGEAGGNCVELADLGEAVGIRDNKGRSAPSSPCAATSSRASWRF